MFKDTRDTEAGVQRGVKYNVCHQAAVENSRSFEAIVKKVKRRWVIRG